ncbi:MAG: hypothetical protein ACREN3_05885 [Gemmatimonadaceae bacterium]
MGGIGRRRGRVRVERDGPPHRIDHNSGSSLTPLERREARSDTLGLLLAGTLVWLLALVFLWSLGS